MTVIIKRILIGLGIFAAVVAVVLVGLFIFLDSAIKAAIEKGAPTVIGCKATVEKVSVKPFSGSVRVRNLRIASPEGYEEPELFAIEEFRVKLDVGSLFKKDTEPIVIHEVVILKPLVAYEVVKGKTNFETILARFPKDDAPDKPKDGKKPGRKVILDRVEFRDGQVNVRAGYTLGYGIGLPLPSLELTDIGRKSGGLTAAQAVGYVLGSLASSVTNLVTDSAKFIADQAKNLAEGAVGAGKAVLDAGGKAGKAALDAGGKAVKGLKELF